MAIDVDQVCDVCGREGNIALRERIGPYPAAVCHLCRYLGVTSAEAVADYESPADQRDRKLRRHREFTELPGPGTYTVTLPWHKITGGQLPPLCCVCLGPANDSFPAPLPEVNAGRLGRHGPHRDPDQDPPEADLPTRIERPTWTYLVFILAIAVVVAIALPLIALWPVMFLVVLFLMHWTGARARHERYTTLPVPICRRCRAGLAPGDPPARVIHSAVSAATVAFSNWEYAELVRAVHQPDRSPDRTDTPAAGA